MGSADTLGCGTDGKDVGNGALGDFENEAHSVRLGVNWRFDRE
jgi:hypothetical protein